MILIIPFFLFTVCYLVGDFIYLIKTHNNNGKNGVNKILLGYLVLISLFQFISLPAMYFAMEFRPLFFIYIGIIIGIIIISIFFRCKWKIKWIEIRNYSLSETKFYYIIWGTILLIIFFQIYVIINYQHIDADDSFYISSINTILGRNRVLDCDPSTGILGFPFTDSYKLVSYEVWLAVICKLFFINPALLCHTIIPIFFVIIHYLIIYKISLTINKEKTIYFMFLFCILNLFSGYSVYNQGAFLFFRIWQGKAVLVNIILPALFWRMICIYKEKKVEYFDLFYFFLLLVAGFHSTTVGLYLIPLAYGAYTITYFLYCKNIKQFMLLFIPILGVLPLVFLKALILFGGNALSFIQQGGEGLSYLGIIKNFNGQSFTIIIFIVIIIFIAYKGERFEKYIFGFYSLILFCTVLNPFLVSIIAEKITGVSVYWRLLWLLQINFVLAVGMLRLSFFPKKSLQKGIYFCCILLIVLNGKFIVNKENFQNRSNWYKIDNDTKDIADSILMQEKNKILLLPEYLSLGIRQYTPYIKLAWSRYTRGNYLLISKEDEYNLLYEKLYQPLYEEKSVEGKQKEVLYYLNYFKIDYIFLYNDLLGYNDLINELKLIDTFDKGYLFKINNH